jgi:hypothetical protein
MGVNWFEGGRRILALLVGLIIIGAALFVFFGGGDNPVVLETNAPDQRLHWTLKGCDYPDVSQDWSNPTSFGGSEPRRVVACYRAKPNGKVIYAFGPQHEIDLHLPQIPGEGPPPKLKVRKIYDGDYLASEVDTYVEARRDAFQFTYRETQEIGSGLWKIGVVRWAERVTLAIPWVLGSIFGIWVLAMAFGWLVRGFAGIPSGQDFKTGDQGNVAPKSRVPDEWVRYSLVLTGVAGLVAWSINAVFLPWNMTISPWIMKILTVGGKVVVGLVGFGLFFVGAWALKSLFYLITKRPEPQVTGDQSMGQDVVFGMINLFIMVAAAWVVTSYTFVGNWTTSLDRWSRANGYADGATVALSAIFLLWPLIPLYFLKRSKVGDAETVG